MSKDRKVPGDNGETLVVPAVMTREERRWVLSRTADGVNMSDAREQYARMKQRAKKGMGVT